MIVGPCACLPLKFLLLSGISVEQWRLWLEVIGEGAVSGFRKREKRNFFGGKEKRAFFLKEIYISFLS